MKSRIVAIVCMLLNAWMAVGTTVTIGTGTSTQRQPFGMWYGYERSASIYTYSEVGGSGFISSLNWYVGTSDPNTCPVKIYLKTTSSTTITAGTWASAISGATLVYDGITSFTTTGWVVMDIADFAYSGSASVHLMVLCETDFGEPAATTYPTFRYSNATSKHEFWAEVFPPTASGTVNGNRPNIQITYTALSGVIPPSGFIAVAASSSQVNLSWKKNSSNDNVMVAYSTTNTFGTPTGSYVAGNLITGGGTVIYNGSGVSFNQTTDLTPNTTYYYRAWSVHAPTPTYSSGAPATATTFCTSISSFPYTTDFETANFPPSCWKVAGVPWTRSAAASAYGNGTGSAKADFFNTLAGNFDLISPRLDLSGLNAPVVTFDEAYATYATEVDNLEVYYSTDNGSTYLLLDSWTGGPTGNLNTGGTITTAYTPSSTQWSRKKCNIPAGSDRILFRGISGHGNNLYLDNISFFDTICQNGSIPYAENLDMLAAPSTGCISVTNNNSDSQKWSTSALYPRSAPNSMYLLKNASAVMNDWFFTPGLTLTGGTSYQVSFYYRTGGAPSNEKMEVKWGIAPNEASMNGGQIWNSTTIQTTSYLNGTALMTPSVTGTYYIGWHGYSAANTSYICVDDITIIPVETNPKWNGSASTNWNDPLNWTPNGVPDSSDPVTIPDDLTTSYPPSLPASAEIQSLTIESGGILNAVSNAQLTINGSEGWVNEGGTFNAGTSKVIFSNGSAVISGTTNFFDLTINPGAVLTIASGSTLRVAGTLTNNGGFTASGRSVTFNGTAPQTIAGSASTTFFDLIIDNSFGISLAISASVTGTLTFTNGKITLGAFDLLLGNSAAISGSNSARYVVTDGTGSLRQRVQNNATDVAFPIGLATAYLPVFIQLTAGSVADDFKARVINGLNMAYDANDLPTGAPVSNRAVLKTWCLKENVSGGSTATIKVQWNSSDESSDFARSWCDLAHYSGGSWLFVAGSAAAGAGPYTQTLSNITTFSPFGVFGQNITSSFEGSSFCAGSSLSVSYSAAGGIWNSGNSFTAQLSDAAGSFASPVTIGTVTSQVSGTISTTIPSNSGDGTAYKIRVVSSNPAGTGEAGITGFTINHLRSIKGNMNYCNLAQTKLTGTDFTVKLYRTADVDHSDLLGTTNPDALGYYEFTNLCPDGSYDVVATSTRSTDGSVNSTDAAQVNFWFVGGYPIEKTRFYAGDVAGGIQGYNNFINSTDALRIQYHFVDETPFDRSGWIFWKAGETISANPDPPVEGELFPAISLAPGGDVVLNLYGLCAGDFNRSFNPDLVKSATSNVHLLTDETKQAEAGQEIDLSFRIINPSGVTAISLILDFPGELADVEDVIMQGVSVQPGWTIREDRLRIGWNSSVAAVYDPGALLLTLKLKTTAEFTSGKSIRFTLTGDPLNEIADGSFNAMPEAILATDVIAATPISTNDQEVTPCLSMQVSPNPFEDITSIFYSLPREGQVTIEIYDLIGKHIMTAENKTELQGVHSLNLEVGSMRPGIYLATLKFKNNQEDLLRVIKLVKK